jgi:hypothetical protein
VCSLQEDYAPAYSGMILLTGDAMSVEFAVIVDIEEGEVGKSGKSVFMSVF